MHHTGNNIYCRIPQIFLLTRLILMIPMFLQMFLWMFICHQEHTRHVHQISIHDRCIFNQIRRHILVNLMRS